MPEPVEQTPDEGGAATATSNEIARSLGTVWQRFSGARPKSTSVEMGKDVVRCVIEEGTAEPVEVEEADTPAEPARTPDSQEFQHDASAAIARATGRRVVAFIPKRNKKAQTSQQTFVLDRPRRRF